MSIECDSTKYDFIYIQRRFLSGFPIKSLDWDKLLSTYDRDCEVEWQKSLLQASILHPLIKKYPLKTGYMQAFLKTVISQLESKAVEVCDELYEASCALMSLDSGDRTTHYRHYMLNTRAKLFVTLEESDTVISQGTTGLCSWQASQALANWCLSCKEQFRGKCVLELGSGVGLTGLAVSLGCEPRSFWFSDCHPAVLNLLQSNIRLNGSSQGEPSSGQDQTYSCQVLLNNTLGNTQVYVVDLPWEDVALSNIKEHIAPDIVLAADVVYDSSIFVPLCDALCHLLESTKCVAILACTVRNEETLCQFVELLKNQHLIVSEEDMAEPSVFIHPLDTPIRIYRVTAF